jgi:transposase
VKPEFTLWVGIDWATEEHQVCGVDAQSKRLFEWKVPHSGDGIADFVERLLKKAGGRVEEIAVAIETPRGAIVEALIDRGIASFSINPKQADRFRDRHRVSGAKSDALDAFVLADSLRTDEKLYRRIELGDELVVELRELRRAHEALTRDGVGLVSRLREQIHRYYPQILELGSLHDDRWLLALIERAPTPAEGAHLSLAKAQSLLRKHHIRVVTAEDVVTKLRAKALPVAPGVVAAASGHVRLLLPLVRVNREQMSACHKRIGALLKLLQTPEEPEGAAEESTAAGESGASEAPKKQHRDAAILLSVAGLGTLTGASMLAEGWKALRDRDYQALRAQCGVAPVSSQTGKQKQAKKSRHKVRVTQRYACNEHLRNALYHWSNVATQHDDKARAHYARLRKAGHTHPRALRGVGDRLLKMLIAMLEANTLYDPTLRALPDLAA